MRHCHFHFPHRIRFSLCLALFLIGLGIFCAAVCQCADSDTWIAQFLNETHGTSPDTDQNFNSATGQTSNVDTDTAFDAYLTELFKQEASANLLNLHYTLEDPSAYGITEYQTSLGSYTSDSPKKAAAFAENILTTLQQFDSEKLSTENQLALDILNDHLTQTKASADFYCYDEPLTPTTGLQSQLPILLAEYTFHNQQDISDYLELLADIPRYFSQICAYEEEKAAAGRLMP